MSNRWFIYMPQIEADSFVFFYFKGSPKERSWSVRNYTSPDAVQKREPIRRYASKLPNAFPWTAEQVLGMAERKEIATVHPTSDFDWYHRKIRELNEQLC